MLLILSNLLSHNDTQLGWLGCILKGFGEKRIKLHKMHKAGDGKYLVKYNKPSFSYKDFCY